MTISNTFYLILILYYYEGYISTVNLLKISVEKWGKVGEKGEITLPRKCHRN